MYPPIPAAILIAAIFGVRETYGQRWLQRQQESYCGRDGRVTCCDGRNDSCSFPRGYGQHATLCYCDRFCTDTHPWPIEPDCCPDYRRVCLGEEGPSELAILRECFYKGKFFQANERFRENCRVCQCMDMDDRMEIMCSQDECAVESERISEVNSQAEKTWRAENITRFWGLRLQETFEEMLGTNYSSRKVRTMYPIRSVVRQSDLPRDFDWRDKPGYVTPIVDQQLCNASWSYAIVSAFSDRLSKWSRGKVGGPLSYQQHRNCVRGQRRQTPCSSGHLTRSWKYLMRTGLMSESCYGQSMNSRCELVPERRSGPKTRLPCPSGSGEYVRLYKASPLSRISGQLSIMKEILDAGPVVATMRIFPEFFSYKSGVYACDPRQPTKTGRLHSVKIVGWGEDYIRGRRIPYWIAANSWGTEWGENGFFRILRGSNSCDIEEFVLSFYINSRRARRSPSNKGISRKRRNF